MQRIFRLSATNKPTPKLHTDTLREIPRHLEEVKSHVEHIAASQARERAHLDAIQQIPFIQRNGYERKSLDISIRNATAGNGLPLPLRAWVTNYASNLESFDLVRPQFWKWYSRQDGSGVRSHDQDALPSDIDGRIISQPVIARLEQKVQDAWKYDRRDKQDILQSLEKLQEYKPQELSKKGWEAFLNKFKQCYDNDPSERKTFKTVSKVFLSKYDSAIDMELYCWCSKQLKQWTSQKSYRDSRGARMEVIDASLKKREKKALDKLKKKREAQASQDSFFNQKTQTNLSASDDESIFKGMQPFQPARIAATPPPGRKLDSIILNHRSPTPPDGKRRVVFSRYRESPRFQAWVAREMPDKFQHEHDYDTDQEQVEQAICVAQHELVSAVNEFQKGNLHLVLDEATQELQFTDELHAALEKLLGVKKPAQPIVQARIPEISDPSSSNDMLSEGPLSEGTTRVITRQQLKSLQQYDTSRSIVTGQLPQDVVAKTRKRAGL